MSESLRIVLNGQAAFGEKVLNALLERGEDVVAVFCAPDVAGKPQDPIKVASLKHGIPVFQFNRMRDDGAIEAFRSLRADLGVMAFVTDIAPRAILEAPTKGTIQYHPSLLPKHRGPSSINWPIIQGESKTGLSIFWPDDGLDTGPILLQKEVEIGPDDTLGTIYFGKLFEMGVEAMIESVEMVKAGTAPRIEQDESQVTYESWCTTQEVVVDWGRPVSEIYNMIRGSDPSPGANSTLEGLNIKFFKASKEDGDTGAAPGEVVSVSEESFTVAAQGGAIIIRRVQPAHSGKLPAAEWIAQSGLNLGSRFGT